MKFFITFEETISETFEINAKNYEDALKLAIKKYTNSELIVENGNLISKKVCVSTNIENDDVEWIDF